jgi:hypothetical protein
VRSTRRPIRPGAGAKVEEFREKLANRKSPPRAASSYEIIRPRETRRKLIAALRNLENKRDVNPPKKHGNIPLWRRSVVQDCRKGKEQEKKGPWMPALPAILTSCNPAIL